MTKLTKSQIKTIKEMDNQSYIFREVQKLGYNKSRQTFNNCFNRKKVGRITRIFTPYEEDMILEVISNIVNGLNG